MTVVAEVIKADLMIVIVEAAETSYQVKESLIKVVLDALKLE